MGYLKHLEKAFDSSGDGEDLRISSTEDLAKSVMNSIRKSLVSSGLYYSNAKQSAMYWVRFSEKPIKTNKDLHNNKLIYSIEGWHGTGSGNRNYGSSFTIFDITSHQNNKTFTVLDSLSVNAGLAKFNSYADKKSYITNLNKIEQLAKQNKLDSLF